VLVACVLGFFILANSFSNIKSDNPVGEKTLSPLSQAKLTSTPTPTLSPTPTPTPTPTPVPLIGYCLKVPVLFYHHVQPQAMANQKRQGGMSVDNAIFDQQMGYLAANGYKTITARELVDALRTHGSLPSKSVVVTLDDGYRDIHEFAYPVFQKYHIVANLMIATGLLGGADYMSWGDVEEMTRSGLIYLTDHTWSHYGVGTNDVDKIKFEVETAKTQLKDHTGQKIDIFTYPYGSFNNTAIKILRDDGFIGAFSTIPGFWQCDSFIMALHRTRVGNSSLPYYGL